MKKRHAPILLITLLAILAVTGAIFNSMAQKSKSDADQMPEPENQSRDTDNKNAIASAVKADVSSAKKSAPKGYPTGGHMMGPDGMPVMPLIAPHTPTAYKPKPNESSVQGQWYAHEHLQGNGG
jgi:hypothetical protein